MHSFVYQNMGHLQWKALINMSFLSCFSGQCHKTSTGGRRGPGWAPGRAWRRWTSQTTMQPPSQSQYTVAGMYYFPTDLCKFKIINYMETLTLDLKLSGPSLKCESVAASLSHQPMDQPHCRGNWSNSQEWWHDLRRGWHLTLPHHSQSYPSLISVDNSG